MFPIIRRDVVVVLTQTGAVFFWCHRLSLFRWHNIFVHLFEDLCIITHCELSYQDFVRMSSLMVHCERNSPVTGFPTRGFPTLKASNTDHWLFTRGQFWPSGIVIACVCGSVCPCVCMCVCINHELVRTITHRPFKLGSPNLDQRCKTPWFRSLLFLGMLDPDLQGQI